MRPIKLGELTIIFGIDGILLIDQEPSEFGPRPKATPISPGTSRVLAKHYAHAFRVIADHFETTVEPWAEQADVNNPTLTLKKAEAAIDRVYNNYGYWSEEYGQVLTEGPSKAPSDVPEWDY